MTQPNAPQFYLIGLGANLGDRAHNIAHALAALEADERNTVVAESMLWSTPPYLPPDHLAQPGATPHPDYLNACAVVRTDRDPETFLQTLLACERAMGRLRDPHGPRYQPRPIDLDIILWSGGAFRSPTLELPHPRFEQRAFVLMPLQQVFAAMPAQVTAQYNPVALIAQLPPADAQACRQIGPLTR